MASMTKTSSRAAAMETVLRPWLTTVDAALPPRASRFPFARASALSQWRVAVYGDCNFDNRSAAMRRPPIRVPVKLAHHKQRQLREAFSLFALALHVDREAFAELVSREVKSLRGLRTRVPFGACEKLRLRLKADLKSDTPPESGFYSSLLQEQISSDAYNSARRELLEGVGEAEGAKVELTLKLRMCRDETNWDPLNATPLVSTLVSIDRNLFDVVELTLVITTADCDEDSLTALFREIHSFRHQANVHIRIEMPCESADIMNVFHWKTVFDLAARRRFSGFEDAVGREWKVSIACGHGVNVRGIPLASSAAPVVGGFSGLAHCSDFVTSVRVEMGLEDARDERHIRAKWFGYLLRSGGVKKLSLDDECLTMEDVELMESVYSAPTRKERLRVLWEEEWHNLDLENATDDNTARRLLPDQNEVIGMMHDILTDEDDEPYDSVDVFIVSYGQCGIDRGLLPMIRAMDEAAAALPEPEPALRSLHLYFRSGFETSFAMVRLITVIGATLEELSLEMEETGILMAVLVVILESCPNLRRLTVKALGISAHDDMLRLSLPRETAHPLESVTIEVAMSEDGAGFKGFCEMLGWYGANLKELEIRGPQRTTRSDEGAAALTRVLQQRLPCLTKLHVAGFNGSYLECLKALDGPGSRKVDSLVLENNAWESESWVELMAVLKTPSHPLARSLHTLHIRAGFHKLEDLHVLADMLNHNHFLVDVFVDRPLLRGNQAQFIEATQVTSGCAVHHRASGLPLRHKLAFLSGVATSPVHIDIHVLALVFEFAAIPKTRSLQLAGHDLFFEVLRSN